MFTYVEYNPKVFLLCKGKKKETIFMFPFSDRVGSTGIRREEWTLDGKWWKVALDAILPKLFSWLSDPPKE